VRALGSEARGARAAPRSAALSRAVGDSATVTGALIPWNSCGAFMATTLGVATVSYVPFAVFCWLSPLVTIAFSYAGLRMLPLEKSPERPVAP